MSQSKWRLRFSTSYWLCKCRYSIYSTYYGNRDTRSGFITLNDFTSLKGWAVFSFAFGAENPPAEEHYKRFAGKWQHWRGQQISNELSYWAGRNQHEPNSTAQAASATKPAVSPGLLWVLNTPDRAPWRAWTCLPFVLPFSIHSELTVLFCSANMLLSLACLWTLSRGAPSSDEWFCAVRAWPRGMHVCGAFLWPGHLVITLGPEGHLLSSVSNTNWKRVAVHVWNHPLEPCMETVSVNYAGHLYV